MVTLEGNVVAGQLSKLQVYTSIYSRQYVGKFVRQSPGRLPPAGRDLQAEGGQARAAAAERGRPERGQEVRLAETSSSSSSAPSPPLSARLAVYNYTDITGSDTPIGEPRVIQGCLDLHRVILGYLDLYRVIRYA